MRVYFEEIPNITYLHPDFFVLLTNMSTYGVSKQVYDVIDEHADCNSNFTVIDPVEVSFDGLFTDAARQPNRIRQNIQETNTRVASGVMAAEYIEGFDESLPRVLH